MSSASRIIEITNRMYNFPIRRVATGNGIKPIKSRQGRETGRFRIERLQSSPEGIKY